MADPLMNPEGISSRGLKHDSGPALYSLLTIPVYTGLTYKVEATKSGDRAAQQAVQFRIRINAKESDAISGADELTEPKRPSLNICAEI